MKLTEEEFGLVNTRRSQQDAKDIFDALARGESIEAEGADARASAFAENYPEEKERLEQVEKDKAEERKRAEAAAKEAEAEARKAETKAA
jgi:hypothetical protein